MILRLAVFLTIVVVDVASQSSCHLRQIDLCAANLLAFSNSPSGIPATSRELDKQCVLLREGEYCFKNYTKRCTTALQREVVNFFTERMTRLRSDLCNDQSPVRESYLKQAPCLSRLRWQRDCEKQLNRLKNALNSINELTWDQRIPIACCGYRRLLRCVNRLVESKCGKEAAEFLTGTIRTMVSGLPDIVCHGFTAQHEQCKSLRSQPVCGNRQAKDGNNNNCQRNKSVLTRALEAYIGL